MRWLSILAMALATVPLAAVVSFALANWARRRGIDPPTARRHAIAEVAMVIGTVPWVWMILTPLYGPREIRPYPLRDLATQLDQGLVFAFIQITGNLLVFAAFGFFAPRRWRIGVPGVTVIAAIGSTVLEILQYTLALGRVTSVDDVLVNATGAGLAALVSLRWFREPQPGSGRSRRSPVPAQPDPLGTPPGPEPTVQVDEQRLPAGSNRGED